MNLLNDNFAQCVAVCPVVSKTNLSNVSFGWDLGFRHGIPSVWIWKFYVVFFPWRENEGKENPTTTPNMNVFFKERFRSFRPNVYGKEIHFVSCFARVLKRKEMLESWAEVSRVSMVIHKLLQCVLVYSVRKSMINDRWFAWFPYKFAMIGKIG